LGANPSSPVTVEGHTDSIGSNQYNQKLSERRANAVRQYLIEKGIASSRIQVIGYGEERPIADNKTAEGRAKNRRAEFQVTVEKR
jgi:OOP family OmpA-OmpF porin